MTGCCQPLALEHHRKLRGLGSHKGTGEYSILNKTGRALLTMELGFVDKKK